MGKASRSKSSRSFGSELGTDLKVEFFPAAGISVCRIPVALSRRLKARSCIYRFVDKPSYVTDMLAGDIWITTLAVCRTAQGNERGDTGEGEVVHQVNYISSEEPGGKEAIDRSGIFNLEPGARNAVICGGGTLVGTMDAFVLCFTERYAPETMEDGFGKWCVQLDDPLEVFKIITQELSKRYVITRALIGYVHYSGRQISDYESLSTHRALLKPIDGYTHQREIRMIWEVDSQHFPIKPFSLHVPAVSKFFSLKDGSLD